MCTVNEVGEWHEAYKKVRREMRVDGEIAGGKSEPWERKEMEVEEQSGELEDKARSGHLTVKKYMQCMRDLNTHGCLYEEEYESDLSYDSDS